MQIPLLESCHGDGHDSDWYYHIGVRLESSLAKAELMVSQLCL